MKFRLNVLTFLQLLVVSLVLRFSLRSSFNFDIDNQYHRPSRSLNS